MDDIDPFERLKLLETQTYNKRYFYYEATDGSVVSIRNRIVDEPYPFVEISLEELPDNFSSLNLTDFLVITENEKKPIVSIKKSTVAKIDGSIPVIYISSREEIKEITNDLLIEQDNNRQEFRLSLSKRAKDHYARTGTALNFMFFVTLENDPSILYTTFVVPFKDLLENAQSIVPFEKYDGSKSRIYTIKFFQRYLHAVYHENTNA